MPGEPGAIGPQGPAVSEHLIKKLSLILQLQGRRGNKGDRGDRGPRVYLCI